MYLSGKDICSLYFSKKISSETYRLLKEKHKSQLEKRRKYKCGEQIENLDDLLKCEWIYVKWWNKPAHIKVIKNLQLSLIEDCLSCGAFCYAIKKEENGTTN